MTYKRGAFFALVLAIILVISLVPGRALGEDMSTEEEVEQSAQEAEESPTGLTLEDLSAVSFTDIAGKSGENAIRYVACRQIMQGVGNNTFYPDGYVTRSATAVTLQRLAVQTQMMPQEEEALEAQPDTRQEEASVSQDDSTSEEAPAGEEPFAFSDVAPDDWYAQAVNWGAQAGIITGKADGSFAPDQRVTRAQLAVMLYRYADYIGLSPAPAGDLSAYRDGNTVPAYAAQALAWALEQGVFDPLVSDTIYPQLPVSRAQFAQILTALIAYSTQEPLAVEFAAQDSLEPVTSASRAAHTQIQNVIESTAAKYGAEGVQVVVIEDGKVTDAFATGWATRNVDPMTVNHRMRIASISKVVVGMETMRLKELGRINLDVPIGTYWGVSSINPYYPNNPVNIRSVLSHTSSISNLGDSASRSYSAVRSRLAGSGYSRLVPGSIGSWSYNNYAFSVLGMTAELAANQNMNSLLNRDFFDIMQIDGAFSAGDLRDNSKLVTLVYANGGVARSTAAQRNIHSSTTPGASGTFFAGGLTISGADLGKLVAMLANDGNYEGLQLLQPQTVALMESINPTQLSDGSYQGLPLRYQKNLYGRDGLYYHTGSAYGVYNWISYDPATKDGIVVLTVGASGAKDSRGIYAVCGEISSYVYDVTKG